jgi:Nucleoside transporter
LLFPWNAYITADDYYEELWPSVSFEFLLTLAYNYPGIVMLFLNIRYGRLFPFSVRMAVGFVVGGICMMFVPIITTVPNVNSVASMWATLGAVFLSGVMASMLFGTVLGLSAIFPGQYTGAVMSGNGVAGIIVGLTRIFTKLAFADTVDGLRNSSVLYFVIAGLVMFFCAGSYGLLLRSKFGRYYIAKNEAATQTQTVSLLPSSSSSSSSEDEGEDPLLFRDALDSEARNSSVPNTPKNSEVSSSSYGSVLVPASADNAHVLYVDESDASDSMKARRVDQRSPLRGSTDGTAKRRRWKNPKPRSVSYWSVFKRIWPFALEVFWVFCVTLTIFPGMTLQIQSQFGEDFQPWFGIILIFIFQLFDYIGRTLPKWMILFTPRTLWIPVVLRTGIVVLFIFCINPRYIYIDGFPYLFMAVFALTNGYCGTLAMMFAPDCVEDHEKESAGAIMGFMLNLGIFVAAHLALLVLYLVNGPSSLPQF